MKKIILLLLISLTTCGQTTSIDTIFLLNGKMVSKGNKIYIQQHISKNNFDILRDFSALCSTVKSTKLNCNHLSDKWIPLYLYEHKYYTYMPCDLGTSRRVFISNKEIVFEGYELNKYKLNSKINCLIKNNYKFSYTNNLKNKTSVVINIINEDKGIAVFKYTSNNKSTYHLMVDANKIKSFPIIVNECNDGKVPEFDFEVPNFKKLMNQ